MALARRMIVGPLPFPGTPARQDRVPVRHADDRPGRVHRHHLAGRGLLWAGRGADAGRRRQLAWGAALLAACDLCFLNFKYLLATSVGNPEPPMGYAATLARDPEPYRVLPVNGGDSWPEGFLISRVPSVLGYDPIIPAAYIRYLAAAAGKPVSELDAHEPKIDNYSSPLMDRLNVKYVLTAAPLSDPSLTLVSDDGLVESLPQGALRAARLRRASGGGAARRGAGTGPFESDGLRRPGRHPVGDRRRPDSVAGPSRRFRRRYKPPATCAWKPRRPPTDCWWSARCTAPAGRRTWTGVRFPSYGPTTFFAASL